MQLNFMINESDDLFIQHWLSWNDCNMSISSKDDSPNGCKVFEQAEGSDYLSQLTTFTADTSRPLGDMTLGDDGIIDYEGSEEHFLEQVEDRDASSQSSTKTVDPTRSFQDMSLGDDDIIDEEDQEFLATGLADLLQLENPVSRDGAIPNKFQCIS